MTLSAPVLSLLDATPDDMAAVLRIYTHHVLYGAASFEEQPPTLAEMQLRLGKVRKAGLPWLVAKSEGRIVGYCYATPYRPGRPIVLPWRTRCISPRGNRARRRQGSAERADRPL